MIGRFRPLARYESPMSRIQRTGEVEPLTGALELSFPRGESETPITVMSRATAFSASYAWARTRWYAPHAMLFPVFENCGCQKRGWFGSLPTAMSLTWG